MRQVIRFAFMLASIFCLLIAFGRARRQVAGDVSIYAPEPWFIAAVGIAAVIAAVGGWYLRRTRQWPGTILLGGGLLVLGTTVPGLALSRALVDADHVEWNRGFHRYHFRFADLARIDHSSQNIPIGRGRRNVHYLDFTTKAGATTHIQVEPGTDRYLEDAIPEILRRAASQGVPCTESIPDA